MKPRNLRRWSIAAVAATAVAATVAVAGYAQAGGHADETTYDFDCDSRRDAVHSDSSAPVDGVDAGAVTVKYSTTGEKSVISQATPGIAGSPEHEDGFGETVAVYDETGDGCDDLIVGAPDEDIMDAKGVDRVSAGMIWIIPGSPDGLSPADSRGVHLDSSGVPGSVADGDRFGAALAADNGVEEPMIVVGAPGVAEDAGAAYLLRGELAYRITQDSPSVSGAAEPGDRFGASLAVTDRYFAIGVPYESINGSDGAGMAHLFGLELTATGPKQRAAFHQDSPGITGVAEESDHFGAALSVVPYRPTASSAVVPLVSVGTPYEDVAADSGGGEAGMAHLLTSPAAGQYRQLTQAHENTPGVPGDIRGDDVFGLDTVLSVAGPDPVGTPSDTRWVVGAEQYDHEDEQARRQVFVLGVDPGTDAVLLDRTWFWLESDPDHLYLSDPAHSKSVTGIPWGNILDGETEPEVVYDVG